MGSRGPVPTPTAVLKLHGSNRVKARERAGEPMPEVGVPTMPDWLSPAAQTEWARIVTVLQEVPGLLTTIDRTALAMLAQDLADFVEVRGLIARDGWVITTTNGNTIQNPLVGMANGSCKRLMRMLAEFGMSPAARSRLGIQPNQIHRHDEFASPLGVFPRLESAARQLAEAATESQASEAWASPWSIRPDDPRTHRWSADEQADPVVASIRRGVRHTLRSRNNDERVRTAWHEAGHGIVGRLVGRRVVGIKMGHHCLRGESVSGSVGGFYVDRPDPIDLVAEAVAGAMAECGLSVLRGSGPGTALLMSGSDKRIARHGLEQAGIATGNLENAIMQSGAYERAWDILQAHWEQCRTLAGFLMEYDTVWGLAVALIVDGPERYTEADLPPTTRTM